MHFKTAFSILKKIVSTLLVMMAVVTFVFVVLLYFRPSFIEWIPKGFDFSDFGAYVGGTLGALFAFLSFMALLYTLHLQQKQSKTHEIQKFGSTFYSLLELHNRTVVELMSKTNDKKLLTLFNDYPTRNQNPEENTDGDHEDYKRIDDIENTFKKPTDCLTYLQDLILKEVELSQYFRILYQILKFVATNNVDGTVKKLKDGSFDIGSNIDKESEKMYTSIIRGFVPVKLLPVLALNCIPTKDGLHNLKIYKSLLERYEFLEHIRLDSLSLPENLATFLILDKYSHAFGENKDIDKKVIAIKAKYSEDFAQKLTTGNYLSTRPLDSQSK